jgi:hypothetical protein
MQALAEVPRKAARDTPKAQRSAYARSHTG